MTKERLRVAWGLLGIPLIVWFLVSIWLESRSSQTDEGFSYTPVPQGEIIDVRVNCGQMMRPEDCRRDALARCERAVGYIEDCIAAGVGSFRDSELVLTVRRPDGQTITAMVPGDCWTEAKAGSKWPTKSQRCGPPPEQTAAAATAYAVLYQSRTALWRSALLTTERFNGQEFDGQVVSWERPDTKGQKCVYTAAEGRQQCQSHILTVTVHNKTKKELSISHEMLCPLRSEQPVEDSLYLGFEAVGVGQSAGWVSFVLRAGETVSFERNYAIPVDCEWVAYQLSAGYETARWREP